MPKDQKLNAAGEDANAISSFRFAALTSRLGLDVTGYEVGGYKIGAKIETDFYSGVSGVTGTSVQPSRFSISSIAYTPFRPQSVSMKLRSSLKNRIGEKCKTISCVLC